MSSSASSSNNSAHFQSVAVNINSDDQRASSSSQSMDIETDTLVGIQRDRIYSSNSERLPTIVDGKFFKLIPEKCFSYNLMTSCRKCEPELVEIRGNKNSTTNFLTHLKRRHGEGAVEEYKIYKKMKLQQEDKQRQRVAVQPKTQTEINLNQKEFEDLISRFVINSNVPFRVVEDKWLSEIFKRLNIERYALKVPSRRALVRCIETKYYDQKFNIKNLLKNAEYVCTTADVWSGKRRSFLGVTVHWIKENYERESAALACKRFKSSHSFDRIASELQLIHSNYGLNQTKIVATVTDNGSNFVKAFKEFGVDTKFIASSTEMNVFPDDGGIEEESESDSSSESASEATFVSDQVVHEHQSQTNTSEGTPLRGTLSPVSMPMKPSLPDHVRCCSHTLNLCATSDVTRAIAKLPSLANLHVTVMSKCNALWCLASRPKSCEALQDVLGHSLSRPGDTRWNSLYDSLKQIITTEEKVPQLYRQLKMKTPLQLTNTDILYLKEYVECSAPLAVAIDLLQSEKNIFFGVLIPTLVSLDIKLRALQKKNMAVLSDHHRQLCLQHSPSF